MQAPVLRRGTEPGKDLRQVLQVTALTLVLALGVTPAGGVESDTLEFNRDVRPILSRCMACHGPDDKARKAGLRLDTRTGATAMRRNGAPIVPGNARASLMISRVTAADPGDRMPPPDRSERLSDRDVELLRRWIDSGARFDQHWAFVPPAPVKPPLVKDRAWVRNPIDAFVRRAQERVGLDPAPEADRYTLIRRLHLDLTGLPPTLEEVDAFVNDDATDAYEQLVDRIFARPSYGERWARLWLDLARYADSKGYEKDAGRNIWNYRDWVIRALNDDQPFDRFTVDQLAGDLLPDPSPDQLIATAFHRNTMTNDEGGTDDEEFRVEAVVDRVNSTMQVWMGLGMGCARCHNHKYDPISHREYYRFFAFFNQSEDRDRPDDRPVLPTPSEAQRAELQDLDDRIVELKRSLAELEKELDAGQRRWEQQPRPVPADPVRQGLVAHLELDEHVADTSGRYRHGTVENAALAYTPGLLGKAARFDGKVFVDLGDTGDFERTDPFSFGGWIRAEGKGTHVPIARMDNTRDFRGYNIFIHERRIYVHLIHKWPSNTILVVSRGTIDLDRWHHVMVTVDGSSKAAGVTIYLDGSREPAEITHDTLTGSLRTDKPLYLGRRYTERSYRGLLDDVRIYDRALSADEVKGLAARGVAAILERPQADRDPGQVALLRSYYRRHAAPDGWRRVTTELAELGLRRKKLEARVPTTPIMRELPADKQRKTHVLLKGNFLSKGDEVTPGVPAVFHSLPADREPDRLALARWIISENNPLTARVMVNRLWEQLFGSGLVETGEDFGTQGALPSHPELLDWLARELPRRGWSIKQTLKLMVTSATYRQSSRISAEHLKRDPRNRLLARGARFRLEAEMVRDQALAVSGLLSRKMYGPPVYPYQPDGIWQVVYDSTPWRTSKGDDRHRRALYTYWRRTSPYPSMIVFDAPSREFCVPRRPRTNTPLQALVTLNDPVYVEAAQALARRVIGECSGDARARVEHGFRLCLGRPPKPAETDLLLGLLEKELEHFARNPEGARALATEPIGPPPDGQDLGKLAAWTVVSNILLNLDETLTRE